MKFPAQSLLITANAPSAVVHRSMQCGQNRLLAYCLRRIRVVGACDFCGYNPSCVKNCPEDTLDLGVKSGDGKWWAVKAEYIAPKIYNQVFGDYINSLQDYSVLNK